MVCAVQDAVVGNDKMIKRLKPYMEDPNLTVENVSMYYAHLEFHIYCSLQGPVDIFQTFFFQIQKVSRAATVFMHWAKAIYEYAVDGQEILPKRKMIEEIDTQLSTFEQEISANKEIGLQGEVSVNSISSITCGNIPLLKSINWTINRFYFFRDRQSCLKCWNTASRC